MSFTQRKLTVADLSGSETGPSCRRHRRDAIATKCATGLLLLLAWMPADQARAVTFNDVGIYRTVDQMETWAANLAASRPDLVQMVQYGLSAQNRPLIALHITADVAVAHPDRPEFLFTAGIHAREVITSDVAYGLAERLVNGFGTDPAITSELQSRDVWIMPMLNPDGRVYVEQGNSFQRKNMQFYPGQSSLTTGVDLNRNFPHRWSQASPAVADETYRGPSVLSAPEASALWNFVTDPGRFSHLLASIDFHSGAETILRPWTSPSEAAAYPLPAADEAVFSRLTTSLQAISGLSTDRLGYDNYGTLVDSLYETLGDYAFTEEIYNGGTFTGDYFSYFNPLNAQAEAAAAAKGIDSSLYLLSDAAFVVPEPGAVLVIVGLVVLVGQRRPRSPVHRGMTTNVGGPCFCTAGVVAPPT
ncbi:MAG: M14 family zinc carboxypeptidase [Tepidisphaerales bacterium]